MIVLAFTFETIWAFRSSIDTQHTQMLARQAAESGIARARACILQNDRIITWTDAKPLRPNTDCSGEIQAGLPEYIVDNGSYKTTFEIKPNPTGLSDYEIVSSVGEVDTLSQIGGNVIKTSTHNVFAYIHNGVSFNDVVFGNIYAKKSTGSVGGTITVTRQAYYLVKTKLGKVKGAGSNVSYAITGKTVPAPSLFFMTPTDINFPDGTVVIKIFANYSGEGWNTFFLASDGNVYGTGSNYNGQLGTGLNTATGAIVDIGSFVATIQNFFDGIFGFLTTPAAYVPAWPNGAKMDLSQLDLAGGERVLNIMPMGLNTYIFTNQNKVYSTGANLNSLGHTVHDNQPVICATGAGNILRTNCVVSQPNQIEFNDTDLSGDNLIPTYNLSYGRYYFGNPSVVLRMKGGAVFGWGSDKYNSLGQHGESGVLGINGTDINGGYFPFPRALATYDDSGGDGKKFGEDGAPKAVDVATDGGTTWIVDDAGDVWSAGNNSNGQLGRTEIPVTTCEGHEGQNAIGLTRCYGDPIDPSRCKGLTYERRDEDWNDGKCWKRHASLRFPFTGMINPNKLYCHTDDNKGKWGGLWYCYGAPKDPDKCPTGTQFREDDAWGNGKCWRNIGYKYTSNTRYKFRKLVFPTSAGKVIKVAASNKIALFLTDIGRVYGVGINDQGQLGNGSTTDAPLPTLFSLPTGKIAKDIYVTSPSLRFLDSTQTSRIVNSFVVTTDGDVYGAGSNHYGQLGIGSTLGSGNVSNSNNGCFGVSIHSFSIPQRMNGFGGADEPRAEEVRSGFGTTMVITKENRVHTVGNNSHGQLGVGIRTGGSDETPTINPSRTCTAKDYDAINLAAPLLY